MRRSPVRLLVAPLAAALLLTACSGGSDAASSDTSAASEAASGQEGGGSGAGGGSGPEAAAPQDPGAAGPPQQVVSASVVTPGAALIRTAELTVRVDDVRAASEAAARETAAATGTVESEQRTGDGESASAVLRLRVPPAQFDATVERLAGLGEELELRSGTTDVTDQVVDLEARLATQRASVARVRALLDEAQDLADVVQIEGELTRRTADLESLQARLTAVTAQVDMSTIALHLVGDAAATAASGPLGFRDGFAAGWNALEGIARAAAVAAGGLLPFLPVLLGAALLVWRSRRRTAAAAGA